MADPKTPGWKTSEFWATVVTSIFAAVNGAGFLPFQIPDDVVAMIAGLVGTFVLSRLGVKAANASAQAKVDAAAVTANASTPATGQ